MHSPRTIAACLLVGAAVLASAACSTDPAKQKQKFVASGDNYVAAKNYQEAIIQYRNVINLDPNDGAVRMKLGQAYNATGDARSALREYVRAADLMPQDVDAQLAAGVGLLASGQYPEAKTRALAALSQQPKNVAALLLLGNSLAGLKDLDGAIAQVEEAIGADPQRVLSYANLGQLELARGNADAAEAALKRAVDSDPKSVSAHLALGNFYWAASAFDRAESELKQALSLDPQSALANRALAAFYMNRGRAEDSEPYLKKWADTGHDLGPRLVLTDFYVMKGRLAEANQLLQAMVATPEGFAPAQRRLAALDFASGRRKEAHEKLKAILAKAPTDNETILQGGRFSMVEGSPKEALAAAEQVVKNDPRSAAGHHMRGVALRALGRPDDALQAFRAAQELSPGSLAVLMQLGEMTLASGDSKQALGYADQIIKIQPNAGAAHLLRAQALLAEGNLTALDPEVQGLLKGNANSADVQFVAGAYFAARGDTTRARAAYERALALKPDFIPAVTGLVAADLAASQPAAARTRIEKHLAASPDNEELLLTAGKVFIAANDAPRAEAAFKHVLEVNPASSRGYRTLAGFYLKEKKLEDAKREFQRLADQKSKYSVQAITMVGMILTVQGKLDEARAQYERALQLDPKAAVAANNLAWDYARSGKNLDVALNYAQVAKAQMPDEPNVNDTLGWVYYKKGLPNLAVSPLEAAAKLAPGSAGIRYRLGMAYAKNGDVTRAREALTAALKIDPGFPEAGDAKRQLGDLNK
ncbi:MAG: tetratricopeptide repeat protein [Vicinamibacterales bacterium]